MWYRNSYRRHLLDMHINDWHDGRFLSEFDPDVLYENLKRANIKSEMLYLQSHVGYCYYPTKVGHIHSAFKDRPNAMKKLIDKCRQNGIDIVGYYSINYNTIEAIAHPDWTVRGANWVEKHDFSGERYQYCCPNNPDYLQFVLDQVTEMVEYADMDGLFFDMPFWAQTCYCPHCQAKYRAVKGEDIPTNYHDPRFIGFMRLREQWTEEYIAKITAHVRKLRPRMSVEYNVAYQALNALGIIGSEVINRHADYAAGDIYRNFATHSFACKLYHTVTPNQPFEYMTGRCDPSLKCHTLMKSPDKLRLSMLLTVAHHGANFVIDAIDPVGTVDSRVYDRIGELYRETELYEPYMACGDLVADVGLFYSLESRSLYDTSDTCHYNAVINTATILAQHHVPYGIVTQATVDRMGRYKAVILPNPVRLTAETVAALQAYVEQGGILYFSGGKQPELIENLLGGKVTGETEGNAYAAPSADFETLMGGFNAKYPLPLNKAVPTVEGIDSAHVLATVTLPYQSEEYSFSSIHSNPPGEPTDYPAVAVVPYGKGKVVWCAGVPEGGKPLAYHTVLLNLLRYAGLEHLSVNTDAPASVELVTFADEKQILVSIVHVTDNEVSDIQCPFTISVTCDRMPQRVTLAATGEEIPFAFYNRQVTFLTQDLHIFDMYCLDC